MGTDTLTHTPTLFRLRRRYLRLTLRALADECARRAQPVSHSQLSKIERGVSEPRLPLADVLETILGAEMPLLLTRTTTDTWPWTSPRPPDTDAITTSDRGAA